MLSYADQMVRQTKTDVLNKEIELYIIDISNYLKKHLAYIRPISTLKADVKTILFNKLVKYRVSEVYACDLCFREECFCKEKYKSLPMTCKCYKVTN